MICFCIRLPAVKAKTAAAGSLLLSVVSICRHMMGSESGWFIRADFDQSGS